MSTLTPDADFDPDFVNARIRDGTGGYGSTSLTLLFFAFKPLKTRASNRLLRHSPNPFDLFTFFLKHSLTSFTHFCLLSLSSAGMNPDPHSLLFTGSG